MRLDLYLVEKGFFKTRNKAQEAIRHQAVSVNHREVSKASMDITDTDMVEVTKEVHPYVSRGGLKLEAAIESFHLNFEGSTVLDIGASTGGFTDCALKHGAEKVYACDVGRNQLDESLRQNPKVCCYEQTNILDFVLPEPVDHIVMDVSFVSIEKLLPAICRFLTESNDFVCLIKPQFELGKKYFKNGIVKDRKLHLQVLKQVSASLEEYHLKMIECIPSPILGGSGNKEFLALVKKNRPTKLDVKISE